MTYNIQTYILLFMSYAILGWIIEVVLKYIEFKRLINRGFLIGPWLPIYGFGALLITLLLQKYQGDPFPLFALSMIICGTLEYLTSYILEKIFRARWWDYSTNKFNINGRVSLNTMIPFGICGVLIINYLNPFFLKLYQTINSKTLVIILVIILPIFIIDNIVSLNVLSIIRKDNKLLEKDNTEEMSKKVMAKIASSGFLVKRLLLAFPTFKHIGLALGKKTKKALEKINKQRKIMKSSEAKIEKLEKKYQRKISKAREESNKKILRISERLNDDRKR